VIGAIPALANMLHGQVQFGWGKRMPFCANCGAPVEGKFCTKCGAAVGQSVPRPEPFSLPPVSAPGLTDNLASALCYALGLITGVLFLVLAPYNRNSKVRFHAFQSIFLHLAVIVLYAGLILFLGTMLGGFGMLLGPAIALGGFAIWLYMLISTYQGKTVVLPVVGPLAQQQAKL
jgi:uncharacterized membrane protein